MDLDTENRIAAILLREAAELRRQAEKEGVGAYLRKPTVRSTPNSRFLTATVLGVQQANRAVEVNEMWRLRQKELELDNTIKGGRDKSHRDIQADTSRHYDEQPNASGSCSSKKRDFQDTMVVEDVGGLRDDEVEEFLQARRKRGRGAIGSRMDETGPYLPDSKFKDEELGKTRIVLGPEKPFSLKCPDSSDDEYRHERKRKEKKKGSSRRESREKRSKEKLKEEKQKRKEKKSKYYK